MAAVKEDINRNIVLIPRDLVLERILINHITPVKKVVKAIVGESYDKSEGQWKGLPKAGKGDQFYPKFVELANNINDAASKLSGAAVDRAFGRWIDCHSQIPNANADFVAEIRPDCAFVSNKKVVKEVIDSSTSRKIQETLFESNSEDAKIWWRQMIAVVEVERQDGDQLYLGPFHRLCDCMRQNFRQQSDRRFVLGIIISFNNISMWLCDRSGGMGMSEPYDIHKNPEAFVGMISAITLLPSHRIGWDPTLKLSNDPRHTFQPSYQVRAILKTGLNTTSKTEQDISDTQWLLTLKNNVGISSRPKVRSGETKGPTDSKQIDEVKETMAFSDPAFSVDNSDFAKDLSHVTDRAHMRNGRKVWGWPIKFFKDLRELLTVVQEAIQDHQIMYKYGVLHRDVSAGNIIIQSASPDRNLPLRDLVTRTRGRLIDLDHAKHTSRKIAPRAVETSDVDSFEETVTNDPGELELAALRFYPIQTEARYYCQKAGVKNIFKANLNGYRSSPEDLGWEDVGDVPDYESHELKVVERTGMNPFISHKLMTHGESTIHNAIHDLESFWWIIIYLCLTRESGGAHRRKNEDVTEEASCLIHDLFESSDLQVGITKANYFYKEGGAVLFDALLTYFPDYFAPLKPMLKQWRDVLVLGYTFKAYEYHLVHKCVLRIIADAINSLPVPQERSEAIDNEIRRREDDYGSRGIPPSARPTNPPPPTPASKAQK